MRPGQRPRHARQGTPPASGRVTRSVAARQLSHAILSRVHGRHREAGPRPHGALLLPRPQPKAGPAAHGGFPEERDLLALINDLCEKPDFHCFCGPAIPRPSGQPGRHRWVAPPAPDLRAIRRRLEERGYAAAQAVADAVRGLCERHRDHDGADRISAQVAALRVAFEAQYAFICARHRAPARCLGAKRCPLEVSHMHGPQEVDDVARLYLSHFSLDRGLIVDCLMQRYRPHPVAANFAACTTWVLRHAGVIVGASTLRVHADATRGVHFLEVLFHAVRAQCVGLGYGSLLACLLQEKAAAAGVPKIVLHSSLWATKFWQRHGFVDFVEAGRQQLRLYVARHTLRVAWTTPMEYDTVGPRIIAVEAALRRCRPPPPALLDRGTRLRPWLARPDGPPPPTDCLVLNADCHAPTEELAQCAYAVRRLLDEPASEPFRQPVDPIRLCVPDYPEIIPRPMDLGTVWRRLEAAHYPTAAAVVADVELVWANCQVYNGPEHPLSVTARELAHLFRTSMASGETLDIPQRPVTRRSTQPNAAVAGSSSPSPSPEAPGPPPPLAPQPEAGSLRQLAVGTVVLLPLKANGVLKEAVVVHRAAAWARALRIDARGRPHLHLLKADSQFSLKAPDPTGTAARKPVLRRALHRPSAPPAGYAACDTAGLRVGAPVAGYIEPGRWVEGVVVGVPRHQRWVRVYFDGHLYEVDAAQPLFAPTAPQSPGPSQRRPRRATAEQGGRGDGAQGVVAAPDGLCPSGCQLGDFTALEVGVIVFLVVQPSCPVVAVLVVYRTADVARGLSDRDELFDIRPTTAFFAARARNLRHAFARPTTTAPLLLATHEPPPGWGPVDQAALRPGDRVAVCAGPDAHRAEGMVVHLTDRGVAVVYCRAEPYPLFEVGPSTLAFVPTPRLESVSTAKLRAKTAPAVEAAATAVGSTNGKEESVKTEVPRGPALRGEVGVVIRQKEQSSRRRLEEERERGLRYLEREFHRGRPDDGSPDDGAAAGEPACPAESAVDWAQTVGRACPPGYRVGWFADLFVGLQILIPVDGEPQDLAAVVVAKAQTRARAWCAGWHYTLTNQTLFYRRDSANPPAPATELPAASHHTPSGQTPRPHCPGPNPKRRPAQAVLEDTPIPKRPKVNDPTTSFGGPATPAPAVGPPQVPVAVAALCPAGHRVAYVRDLAVGMEVHVAVLPDQPAWPGLVVHVSPSRAYARALARGEFLDLDNGVAFYIAAAVQGRYKSPPGAGLFGTLLPRGARPAAPAVPRGWRPGRLADLSLGTAVYVGAPHQVPVRLAVVVHFAPPRHAEAVDCGGVFYRLGNGLPFYVAGCL